MPAASAYESLSVRELKSELSARRIDITGCSEKQDLVALLQAALNRGLAGDAGFGRPGGRHAGGM